MIFPLKTREMDGKWLVNIHKLLGDWNMTGWFSQEQFGISSSCQLRKFFIVFRGVGLYLNQKSADIYIFQTSTVWKINIDPENQQLDKWTPKSSKPNNCQGLCLFTNQIRSLDWIPADSPESWGTMDPKPCPGGHRAVVEQLLARLVPWLVELSGWWGKQRIFR